MIVKQLVDLQADLAQNWSLLQASWRTCALLPCMRQVRSAGLCTPCVMMIHMHADYSTCWSHLYLFHQTSVVITKHVSVPSYCNGISAGDAQSPKLCNSQASSPDKGGFFVMGNLLAHPPMLVSSCPEAHPGTACVTRSTCPSIVARCICMVV